MNLTNSVSFFFLLIHSNNGLRWGQGERQTSQVRLLVVKEKHFVLNSEKLAHKVAQELSQGQQDLG